MTKNAAHRPYKCSLADKPRLITGYRVGDPEPGDSIATTVNTSLKILRAALNQAKRDRLVHQNEAERVELLKAKSDAW